MNTTELEKVLRAHARAELRFLLPDGGLIPAHAHVTEVGRIDKSFMDCGGTFRSESVCRLQTWVAEDTDHRLSPGKLAGILDRAGEILRIGALPVEVEYEDGFISQFPIAGAELKDGHLILALAAKHTDCLAKESCLPAEAAVGPSSCCGTGGCC
jgi:hypothetical protein